MRLDRNGIPILDPPREANKLRNPIPCMPGGHTFYEKSRENKDYDWINDIYYDEVVLKCRTCGTEDMNVVSYAGHDCSIHKRGEHG